MRRRYAKAAEVSVSPVIWLPGIRTIASKDALKRLWPRQDRAVHITLPLPCAEQKRQNPGGVKYRQIA